MSIVVFTSIIRCAFGLRARNENECVCTRDEITGVALELHVLDGQCLCARCTAVALDEDLSGDGLILTINGNIHTIFLMYDAVAGDVIDQFDGHVACHLMGCIESCLQCHILGFADLCHIVWVANGVVAFHVCGRDTHFTLSDKVCCDILLWELL